MSDEIELASKAIAESVDSLIERSGVLGPVRELADWVTSYIHYRRQPALARIVADAAKRIHRDGVPVGAVSDKLLRALLEGASMEDDDEMQERWANLIANATSGRTGIRLAFAKVLAELEPQEAALLDTHAEGPAWAPISDVSDADRDERASTDNLVRLGLIRYSRVTPSDAPYDASQHPYDAIQGVVVTEFGWQFLASCGRHPPSEDLPR